MGEWKFGSLEVWTHRKPQYFVVGVVPDPAFSHIFGLKSIGITISMEGYSR